MKTVAEMARAAGFLSFNVSGWSNEFAKLDEMIRDDEREKQRAAMQMALEALETELKAFTRAEFDAATDKCVEAITVLREALAKQEAIKADWSDIDFTPKGEWVDLTDDEVETIAKSNDTWQLFQSLRIFDFANTLTAKFKEKNTPVQREQQEPDVALLILRKDKEGNVLPPLLKGEWRDVPVETEETK